MSTRALLITGAVGVGKTTAADAIGDELAIRGVPGAVMDLDRLRQAWPAPIDDRFQTKLTLANLRSMTRNYRDVGAQVLVAAGVLETREERLAHESAFGCPLTVVRLTVPHEVVRARLHRRHELDPNGLAWHLDRYDELTAILDAAMVADTEVPNSGTPSHTARAVLDAAGI
ncbi:AAA family ATPase [Brachybacterium alimentarium]|uniref:Adenylyl-sulfate kinase n=1 Tax=Brachybacterium alimentarium TaxID=47845 RepID=A0A2A3YKY4_9MICO|nr:AAA family ATPase [Brachybacterium alimentarium]PCC39960.1 hypothetical protein CIK66_04670 [Brachybacterium alimentarium]RCS67291.1 hypothetical protein CIK73_10790 [Brachybacterium alimentarium]RCS77199.1 hypothetical protein CIK72_14915 [Brachybacterium alimentarium]